MGKKEDEFKQFTFEVPMSIVKQPDSDTNVLTDAGSKNAVAIVGDRFYKGKFLPADELKKAHKLWENTFHDINHMGTTYITGFFAIPNILYFVGYNDNVKYNSESKSVSMDINIRDDTRYAKDWRAYVNLCEAAGQIPNVSIAFNAKTTLVKAKDLPKGVNWKGQGFLKDDYVEYIYDIIPQALSTVLRGACNDKDGCGIGNSCSVNHGSDDADKKEVIIKWLKGHED